MELRIKATSLFRVRQLPGSELKHVFSLLIVGPVHTYPYSFGNATFFLRFKKKYASTRSVFASFYVYDESI